MASGKLIRLFLRERKRKKPGKRGRGRGRGSEEKADVDKGVESNREIQMRKK